MPLDAGSPQDSKSTRTPGSWTQILLLEDNSARANRRSAAGFRRPPDSDVVLRFHRIENDAVSVAGESAYAPGTLGNSGARGGRSTLALQLLDSIGAYPQETLVVAGPNYGGNQRFTDELQRRGFNWTVELPRNAVMRTEKNSSGVPIMSLLSSAKWKSHDIVSPGTGNILTYAVAHLGYVPLTDGVRGRLFAAQTGAINGVHKGTIIGLSSIATTALDDLLRAVGWARWIRPLVRLEERRLFTPRREQEPSNRKTHVELAARSNIKLSRQHDESASRNGDREDLTPCTPRKVLSKESKLLNVVELFAGAGGMGLGFLLSGGKTSGYRVGFSAEVHPIYAATLRSNHSSLARIRKSRAAVPEEIQPIDLRAKRSLDVIQESMRSFGDTHVLIGGPPCQGFSNANRNSWHGANPHNELVDVFLRFIRHLKPRVFLMENVQGILWTHKNGQSKGELTVANSVAARMECAGYLVFPKLLDAVWYGVPQYRTRVFLLGIHRDLGYQRGDFGKWGPYPLPSHGPGTPNKYTTFQDAARDLPAIGNGHTLPEMSSII